MIRLSTPRLVLRPPSPEDAPSFSLTVGSYDVARWMTPLPWPFTLAMASQWLRDTATPTAQNAMFIIQHPRAGMIGGVTLSGELGFWMKRSHWGKGFATEAVTAVTHWAFASCARQELICPAQHNNVSAKRVLEKIGFSARGSDRRFSHALQNNVDHTLMGLTRNDWYAALGQPEPAEPEEEQRVQAIC